MTLNQQSTIINHQSNTETVLEIENLQTHFFTGEGIARAVDGVSLSVERKKTLGLVGESGCGKSVTALSILRLVPAPPGRIVAGRIMLSGEDILSLSDVQMRSVRGKLGLHDFSGTHDEPQSRFYHRHAESLRLYAYIRILTVQAPVRWPLNIFPRWAYRRHASERPDIRTSFREV